MDISKIASKPMAKHDNSNGDNSTEVPEEDEENNSKTLTASRPTKPMRGNGSSKSWV